MEPMGSGDPTVWDRRSVASNTSPTHEKQFLRLPQFHAES